MFENMLVDDQHLVFLYLFETKIRMQNICVYSYYLVITLSGTS